MTPHEHNVEKARHVTGVETTEYDGGATFRATCHGCGWLGPIQAVKKHAHGDAGDHILDHFEPSLPPDRCSHTDCALTGQHTHDGDGWAVPSPRITSGPWPAWGDESRFPSAVQNGDDRG